MASTGLSGKEGSARRHTALLAPDAGYDPLKNSPRYIRTRRKVVSSFAQARV
jgi:hypothetical protein